MTRLLWGSGRKPFYNSFRVEPFREQLRRLRRMLVLPQLTPVLDQSAPRRAIWIRRKRGLHRGLQNLGEVEALLAERGMHEGRRWEPRVGACCDFAAPLREQARVIGAADLIIGLHGAGLANVLFARRGAILLEYKGFYGITDFVYRKMVQLVHDGGKYAGNGFNARGKRPSGEGESAYPAPVALADLREFKVNPQDHVNYAATWGTLCVATGGLAAWAIRRPGAAARKAAKAL